MKFRQTLAILMLALAITTQASYPVGAETIAPSVAATSPQPETPQPSPSPAQETATEQPSPVLLYVALGTVALGVGVALVVLISSLTAYKGPPAASGK